jgi:uncharacterized protein (DUF1778 family)
MARDPFSNAAAAVRPTRAPVRAPVRRDERLSIRLPQDRKELIQKAADLTQRTMTEFCMSAVVERAEETVARQEQIELSAQDRAVFFQVLMSPPEPNDRLVRAAMASKARLRP